MSFRYNEAEGKTNRQDCYAMRTFPILFYFIYITLYYVMLYYIMLCCYVMLYYIFLFYSILFHLFNLTLYNVALNPSKQKASHDVFIT